MKLPLIGLVLLLAPCGAVAQSPQPPEQPQGQAPALSPAQAQAALDVLNDPQKRAEVTAALEAIIKLQPHAVGPAAIQPVSPPPASHPAAGPAAAQPASPPPSGQPAAAPAAVQPASPPPSGQPAAAPAAVQPASVPPTSHPAAGAAAAQPVSPPPSGQPAAAPASPLVPHSLGAEVLVGAQHYVERLSDDAAQAVDAMQSLPLLWGWLVVMATAPWARALLLNTLWRVVVTLLAGLAVEFALHRACRRPVAFLEGAGPSRSQPTPEEEEERDEDNLDDNLKDTAQPPSEGAVARAEAGEVEPPMPPSRRPSATALLYRLPRVLARFALDLVPVVGFLFVGHLVAASPIGGHTTSRLVTLAVVDAYALCAAVLALARMLLSPDAPRLRLFNIPNAPAAYLMGWTRRLVPIAVFGYASAEAGLLLGLSDVAHEGLLKAVGFVLHVCLAVIVVQKRRAVARALRAKPGATGMRARVQNRLASTWHLTALFFIAATWLVWAVEVPHGFAALLHFFVTASLLLIGTRMLLIVLHGVLDRTMKMPPETAARYPLLESRLHSYRPLISAVMRSAVYILCILAVLQVNGVGTFGWFANSRLGQRIVWALAMVVVTILIALAIWEAINAALHRHLARLDEEQQAARSARLRTLLPLLRTGVLVTILGFATLMVLSEIGVNIGPLLAGAGIVGVAVGFGSQKLVQDLINGIFLLLENAMQVGDFVTVSGLTGTVEALSVRTIRLRAADGSVHVIPFSSVTTVTNVHRGLGNASIVVVVDYQEDTDRVAAVLEEIVEGMRMDPKFASQMLSDLQLWGVDKVDGAGVTIAGQVVCTDSGRWPVQREFNRRMKQRFQELGIRLFNPMRRYNAVTTLPPSESVSEEQAHERARAAE